jgi:uroporphyrinogen-III decarboxylase
VDEYGADNLVPFCGHALESNMLISPQNFKTFSLPYITEMVGKFAETGIANSYIHICSEQIKNLPFYAQVAWPRRTIVTFGIEMPTMTVAEHFPGHVICGPLDPLLIRSGTADEVLTQGKERIEEGKAVPGFALASGCDIPAYSPPINVYQMVKAAKLYGVH